MGLFELAISGGLLSLIAAVIAAIWKVFTTEDPGHLLIGAAPHGDGLYTLQVQWAGNGNCWDVRVEDREGKVGPMAAHLGPGQQAEMLIQVPPHILHIDVIYRPHNRRKHWRDRIDLRSGETYRIHGGKSWRNGALRG